MKLPAAAAQNGAPGPHAAPAASMIVDLVAPRAICLAFSSSPAIAYPAENAYPTTGRFSANVSEESRNSS